MPLVLGVLDGAVEFPVLHLHVLQLQELGQHACTGHGNHLGAGCFMQRRQEPLGERPGAQGVGGEVGLDALRRLRALVHHAPRVVHQAVQRLAPAHVRVRQGFHRRHGGYVAHVQLYIVVTVTANLRLQLRQRRLPPLAAATHHVHVRLLGGHLLARGVADALVGARDHHVHVAQVAAEGGVVEVLGLGFVPRLKIVLPAIHAEEHRAPSVRHSFLTLAFEEVLLRSFLVFLCAAGCRSRWQRLQL
mmetsp:Transcript_7426/g.18906  ORF Transcript_7426/g.18906 Transcript_7426/m.18906 type:complete len:246 (-) Transcript_7426:113-850(-)